MAATAEVEGGEVQEAPVVYNVSTKIGFKVRRVQFQTCLLMPLIYCLAVA